jgi:hypothetical protein
MKLVASALAILATTTTLASAQPAGLTAGCVGAWGRYSAAQGPKAFASGKNGCGWQKKSEDFPTAAAVRAQAMRQCADNTGAGGGCRIISEEK